MRAVEAAPGKSVRASIKGVGPFAVAIVLMLAAIVGPAAYHADQIAGGRELVTGIDTDVRRHHLLRRLDDDFSGVFGAVAGGLPRIDQAERDRLLGDASVAMKRLLLVDSSLDRLISATAGIVPAQDHIALWNHTNTIADSLDRIASREGRDATEDQRAADVLRLYGVVTAARAIIDRIDALLDRHIQEQLESSHALVGTAAPTLWLISIAGAMIGGAVLLFMTASIRRLSRARSDLEASQAELSSQNHLFKDALESMSQGLSMCDAHGHLIVCNRRFVEMYGGPGLTIEPGMPFDDFARGLRATGVVDPDSRLDVAPTEDASWIETLANGRIVGVSRRMRASGGWVGTHEDITELARAQQQRAEAEAESVRAREQEHAAEAACRAKSSFFAIMSHEIRTPLNGLLGLAATLLETSLDADQRRTLEAINQSGESLLAILNDILDLSKLEAGRVQFEAVSFSPRELADDVVGVLGPQARTKGVALFLSVAGDVPALMLGDPGRIRQVLLNLAGNALKFTPAGGEVELVLGCVVRGGEAATLEWAVRDTGIGIAPERVGTLFSDYVQADSSINRRFGGTGLGLAICKRLVEQMGGEIGVRSELGRGSTFAIALPLPVTDAPRKRGAGGPVSHAAFTAALGRLGRPLRLLLVEDNGTNQLVVTRMLKAFEITIRIAEDGLQALAAVADFPCDVILMDVRMPGMDGLEATRRIRTRGGRWATLPIVALTANAFPDDMRACREAGMTGFMAKPVRKTVLIETLAQAVQAVAYGGAGVEETGGDEPGAGADRRAPARRGGGRTRRTADVAPPVHDPAVAAMLREEIGDDGFAETLACFLDDSRRRLEVLGRLAAGVDRETLGIEAHTLKGAAGALGFRRLAEIARALETESAAITAARAAELSRQLEAAFAEADAVAQHLRAA
ncbi:ATP-binding protein [Rhodoplanes sp. TEM]|uniref:histidine kinase n=1 Tax=Rhodoplanes tepidamans TaxID=200616 RepID=A0ABT5JIC6_RHOTP|nr:MULTISPECIES: ATP-binding protein [Rhodoplanes]MDC7789329.1 ATP-binding protein [Rhodoplanes tepidamans]MDC7986018.1 ATP-binding protein [Rhodoplanes sp. TEM]MDQ0358992.1 signal transduction histidine kinase/DNA-binding NarL/FixJ family response regulator [Rhodoplanes tepidamans]